MRFQAEVVEVWLEGEQVAGRISCPAGVQFLCGQYFLAYAFGEDSSARAEPVFPVARGDAFIDFAPPLPSYWLPGTELVVRGPLGKGFHLPERVSHLALAAIGGNLACLLPLAKEALVQNAAVTLFYDQPARVELPAALEVYPLQELPGLLGWADFLALDLPQAALTGLRRLLGLAAIERLSCESQALVRTPLACGGLAGCGVCSIPRRKGGYYHACTDGPVFDLTALDW